MIDGGRLRSRSRRRHSTSVGGAHTAGGVGGDRADAADDELHWSHRRQSVLRDAGREGSRSDAGSQTLMKRMGKRRHRRHARAAEQHKHHCAREATRDPTRSGRWISPTSHGGGSSAAGLRLSKDAQTFEYGGLCLVRSMTCSVSLVCDMAKPRISVGQSRTIAIPVVQSGQLDFKTKVRKKL